MGKYKIRFALAIINLHLIIYQHTQNKYVPDIRVKKGFKPTVNYSTSVCLVVIMPLRELYLN